MADYLDWGTIAYSDIKPGKYAVDESGYRLFFVRGTDVSFPDGDYRKWTALPSGVTAIGRLNTNAIDLDLGIDQCLVSEDKHKFWVIVHVQLRLKEESQGKRYWWPYAVRWHQEIESRVKSIVKSTMEECLCAVPYEDIAALTPAVRETCANALNCAFNKDTPFDVLAFAYEPEADDPQVDAAIASSTVEKTVAEVRQRGRKVELDEVEHQATVDGKKGEHRRAHEAADLRHGLTLKKEQADVENQILKDRIALLKEDPLINLALQQPELYADVLKAKYLRESQVQIAHTTRDQLTGKIQGYREILGLQDFSRSEDKITIDHRLNPDPLGGEYPDPDDSGEPDRDKDE